MIHAPFCTQFDETMNCELIIPTPSPRLHPRQQLGHAISSCTKMVAWFVLPCAHRCWFNPKEQNVYMCTMSNLELNTFYCSGKQVSVFALNSNSHLDLLGKPGVPFHMRRTARLDMPPKLPRFHDFLSGLRRPASTPARHHSLPFPSSSRRQGPLSCPPARHGP